MALGRGGEVNRSTASGVPRGMSSLLRTALNVLEDQTAGPGLRNAACATLLAALDNAVQVPPGTHWACWQYLLRGDGNAASMHRHELAHPDVARDAVRVLRDPEVGESAQDLAMAVLRGSNVAAVTDDDIVSLADQVLTEGRSRRVNWLIEQIHEYRGLNPEFIVQVRDRLAVSDDPATRAASADVGALLPRLDVVFARKLLGDANPLVRAGVVDSLEKAEPRDRREALLVIRDHFGRESHRSVLSACYHVLGSLVRRSSGDD